MTWLTRAGVQLGLAGLFLLGASITLQNAIADGDTRTLSLHHAHTGEDITITFKRNGRYDQAALKKLNWFMRDWRKEQETEMDPHLIDLLWQVYREVGATQPIQIICGYRSPGTNAMLRARSSGVAKFSQHVGGHAIDFFIPGVPLARIRKAGLKLQEGGVGFYPKSGSPFVHMDTANIRHWPRMPREELVKLFPDGRTVHVPADGKPLRNYALALADVERRGKTPNAISLAQARDAGLITEQQELVAEQKSAQPKQTLLAAIFGSGNDEDEDKAEAQAPPPARPAPAPVSLAPPRRVASNDHVPLPQARPQSFALASAGLPKPVVVASAAPEPVDVESIKPKPAPAPAVTAAAKEKPIVVASATPKPVDVESIKPEPAPAPAVTAAAKEENLFDRRGYWQGAVEPAPARDALKARARLALANADPTATGGTEIAALAYAAPPEANPAPERAAKTKPMGSRVPRLISTANASPAPDNTTVVAKSLLPATMAIGGQHPGSPWLRAAMLTPSMSGYMNTTRLGALDPRSLQDLLHKPARSLVMPFSADPNFGMVAGRFSGQAVVFLATTTFIRARTASLR